MIELGGFLDIEFRGSNSIHSNAIALNSGRNSLLFLVSEKKIKVVYIPFFTCDAVYNCLKGINVNIKFYHIDENFMPKGIPSVLESKSLLVYTNYWGLCSSQCNKLIKKYSDKIVIDAAQAYYYIPPNNIFSFNSARKFLGVPDGSFLYATVDTENLKQDVSYERFTHLLKRFDTSGSNSFMDYKKAELKIDQLNPLKMSKLTLGLLKTINHQEVRTQRRNNFEYLHDNLKHLNQLSLESMYDIDSVPMVYPLLVDNLDIRKQLIEDKIYVATYWPNVFDWCNENTWEYLLAQKVLPLPIDQRYTHRDLERMLNLIKL